jgi:hypothetical protein
MKKAVSLLCCFYRLKCEAKKKKKEDKTTPFFFFFFFVSISFLRFVAFANKEYYTRAYMLRGEPNE